MKNVIKKISIIMFAILMNTFVVNTNVFAFNKEIKSVRIVERSGSVNVIEPTLENNEIKTNIEFTEKNDFVTYEIEIENDEDKKYEVESIQDDNKDRNVSIIYEIENKTVEKKGKLKFRVKIVYENELINVKEKNLDDINIKIKLIREDGKEKSIVINNPRTGDGIVKYFILLTFLLIGILYKKKKQKISILFILIAIIILPLVTMASERHEIDIKISDIKIKGYMVPYLVTYNFNNGQNSETRIIRYGEEIGVLQHQKK